MRIRLSGSGLRVVRRPSPGDFGPYLGGRKVRDAVSGLDRVLPLGHLVPWSAGSERELARARGGCLASDGVWTVSFRNPGVADYPGTAHYRNPYAVARHYQPGAQRGRRALMDNGDSKLTGSPLRGGAVRHP